MAEQTPPIVQRSEVGDHEADLAPEQIARLRVLDRIRRHREEVLRPRGGVPFTVEEIEAALASARSGDGE